MNWFEELTGFRELSPQQVRENFNFSETIFESKINGRKLICGNLSVPSLMELKEKLNKLSLPGRVMLREVVADVQTLHRDPSNAGSVFQVASQFNLLEMSSPEVVPEDGIGIYEFDHTQGPKCAIAAGAGTIFRNYFVSINDQVGQSTSVQIDCLRDLGKLLQNDSKNLWIVKNGYFFPTIDGLYQINHLLDNADSRTREELKNSIRIGIQSNTEVTIADSPHLVTQAYCSALPVAYSDLPLSLFEPFARLILEAAYEATVCAAIHNAIETNNNKLFLTLLGGGVFGNNNSWIVESISKVLDSYRDFNLDIVIVSYRRSNPELASLLAKFN